MEEKLNVSALETVTVVDVLESGACFDGVRDWITSHNGMIADATANHIANDNIKRAAGADGYGYGYGSGSGDGDGYGYG